METERRMETGGQFTARETLLLVMLIAIWLGITIQLGVWSLLCWSLSVVMAAILGPAHQRRQTPESATDVLAVAVMWAVAWGVAGLALDVRTSRGPAEFPMWSVLAELMGFYLGLVWVLILLLLRHVQRVARPFDRPRPIA